MATLRHPRETPPDGFFFITSTGIRIDGWDRTELTERVAQHYEWKGVKYGTKEDLWLEIQRQICSGLPKGFCKPEPGENYEPIVDRSRDFSTEMVMSASASVLEWIKTRKFVEQKERERRAAICRTCRFNRPSPSWVCAKLCSVLDALVPEGQRENGLSICGVCACSLRAKVIAPPEVIEASNEGRNLTFPAFCWQNPKNLAIAETPTPDGET